jgi:hypothetical protein
MMGSDNLFHKRKAIELKRHDTQKRAQREKILIVCEGETECAYFQGARTKLGLSSTMVQIRAEGGSAAVSVYDFAKKRYKQSVDNGDAFDAVYCVFDKDNQAKGYFDTLHAIASSKPANVFVAITSVPCFECWVLLHFSLTTKPFKDCEDVNAELNKVLEKHGFKKYQKNDRQLFERLDPYLDTAIGNAQRACQQAEKNQTDNPSTGVQQLIEKLRNINQKAKLAP